MSVKTSRKNRNRAKQHFIDIGVWQQFKKPNMHHKDTSLRHNDKDRYDEWRIEDLEVMECSDHTKLHQRLSGNCMDIPKVKEHHDTVMKTEKVRTAISKTMKEYRAKTKDSKEEQERNRKISEKLKGNKNFAGHTLSDAHKQILIDCIKGKVWYTDGEQNIRCLEGTQPEGFFRGLTKRRNRKGVQDE